MRLEGEVEEPVLDRRSATGSPGTDIVVADDPVDGRSQAPGGHERLAIV
jgi:hypothetical protein